MIWSDYPEKTPISFERQERWMETFREFAERVLEDEDAEEALESLIELAGRASESSWAILFLRSVGGVFLAEYTYDDDSDPSGSPIAGAIGTEYATNRENLERLRSGVPVIVREGQRLPQWAERLGVSGPIMGLPLIIEGRLEGVLCLMRKLGSDEFEPFEAMPAMAFTLQAGLALQLIEERVHKGEFEMLQERDRIGRDLHDLAIQGLFATGMRLRSLQQRIEDNASQKELKTELGAALDMLDSSVQQIRSIVYHLQQDDTTSGLVDHLRREASHARGPLGFAPTLIIEVDEDTVTLNHSSNQANPSSMLEKDLASRADAATTEVQDDVVAVVREALSNVAKHAGATSARVNVSIHGSGPAGEIVVSIIDDGGGLDPAITRQSGLANMQRRATLHGGAFAMGTGPQGRGTAVIWRAPLG